MSEEFNLATGKNLNGTKLAGRWASLLIHGKPKNNENNECDKCNENFENREEYLYHMQLMHPMECVKCDQRFQNRKELYDHFRSAHPLESQKVKLEANDTNTGMSIYRLQFF